MKPVINNPVSNNNMWVSKMPNNFQSAKRLETNRADVVPSSCTHHRYHQQVAASPTPRLTKTTLMKYYVEQLHPQYPHLTKAKVRAALELADNNLHECRLLLDLKAKFIELKKPLSVPPMPAWKVGKPAQPVEANESDTEVAPAKTPEESAEGSARADARSSNVSSVYDFSDTDTDIQSPRDWFEERRANKVPNPRRKIGVLIMKCDNGYKALPL